VAVDTRGMKERAMSRYARLADAGAEALQSELRIAAPHKTYELRNSIRCHAFRSGPTTFKIVAETPVVQAATTNTGARAHIIRPRRAKVLSFYWPKAGHRVAFRFVHHPGNRGTHWWDKTIKKAPTILGRVLRRL